MTSEGASGKVGADGGRIAGQGVFSADEAVRSSRRVIGPEERITEALNGLIMVLMFTVSKIRAEPYRHKRVFRKYFDERAIIG